MRLKKTLLLFEGDFLRRPIDGDEKKPLLNSDDESVYADTGRVF